MRLTPIATPTITGPRNGGGISLKAVLGVGPQGLPGPGSAAWTAAQAVTTGAVRQAPDGSWIKSTANRTTGSSFDATEQTFWETVSATSGTLEHAALSASTDQAIAAASVPRGCRIHAEASQLVASGGWYTVTFGYENYDTDGYHNPADVPPKRMIIPADMGGRYLIQTTVSFAAAGTGYRFVSIMKNESSAAIRSAVVAASNAGGYRSRVSTSDILDLIPGDYITVEAYQDSGLTLEVGDTTVSGSAGETWASLTYLGPSSGTVPTPPLINPDELYYWQVRAALLDPLAYDLYEGSATTGTVPAGETWYVVSGWYVDLGSSRSIFQRMPDAAGENYYALGAGESFTLSALTADPCIYICKPKGVIASDARYQSDPRGLFYKRLRRLTELPQYNIGHNNTGATVVSSAFPADFTYGMVVHASSHDVAWTILRDTATGAGINLNNEVSDSNRIRFAERVVLPFTRAELSYVESQGVSLPEGTVNVRYVKLPGDW